MARDKTIKLYRRIGGAAGAPAALLEGEPGYNDNGDTLDIGGAGGATVHRLVGADRQLELTGTQTVAAGAGNAKTFDLTNFKLLGGAAGNVLSRGATAGDVAWAASPSTAVLVEDPLDGDGLLGSELTVVPATHALATDQVQVGTDNVFPVTSAGLRSQLGAAATAANLGTTATTVVPAIAELAGRVNALASAIVWIGDYDADDDEVTPGANSPFGTVVGPLPAAAPANHGWTVVITVAAIGSGNAPAVPLAAGDWLISSGVPGTGWIHIPLNHPATAAGNVTVTAITGPPTITGTNVQAVLQELTTAIGGALTTIHVDGVSIVGTGLSAVAALAVGVVDGGTF